MLSLSKRAKWNFSFVFTQFMNLFNVDNFGCQSSKKANKGTGKNSAKVAPTIFLESSRVQEGAEAKIAEEISIQETAESQKYILPVNLKDVTNGQNTSIHVREFGVASMILAKQTSSKRTRHKSPFNEG